MPCPVEHLGRDARVLRERDELMTFLSGQQEVSWKNERIGDERPSVIFRWQRHLAARSIEGGREVVDELVDKRQFRFAVRSLTRDLGDVDRKASQVGPALDRG